MTIIFRTFAWHYYTDNTQANLQKQQTINPKYQMKKYLLSSVLALTMAGACHEAFAQDFCRHFEDATLRLDYIFAGNNNSQAIYLDRMKSQKGWYGRRTNMNSLPLQGNGTITVTDAAGTDTLYMHSFSTLFQEWQTTEEATRVAKSFENTFLIPMPKESVQVTVELKNIHNGTKSYFKHTIDPDDRLISKYSENETLPYRYLHKAGDSKEKIDIVFVPEGYTKDEM